MKYLLTLIFLFGISFSVAADDQDTEHTHENDYENGCENELDDDLDGDVDGEDSDCEVIAGFLDDTDSSALKAYAVWGVGIALISSVGSDSGTGTATTD